MNYPTELAWKYIEKYIGDFRILVAEELEKLDQEFSLPDRWKKSKLLKLVAKRLEATFEADNSEQSLNEWEYFSLLTIESEINYNELADSLIDLMEI